MGASERRAARADELLMTIREKRNIRLELRDGHPDKIAAMAARGDYMSESLVGKTFDEAMEGTDKTHQEFLDDKAYRGHFGVFEHKPPAFFVEGLSRVGMAQILRHRFLSGDVQSQRYVNFEEKSPVIPPTFRETNLNSMLTFEDLLLDHWSQSVNCYQRAIAEGIPEEDARFFLPQATPVNMTISGNNRAWMHVMDLRDNAKAQWEAQDLAGLIGAELEEYAPKTFSAYDRKTNNNSLRAP